jgi:hypothetical protein
MARWRPSATDKDVSARFQFYMLDSTDMIELLEKLDKNYLFAKCWIQDRMNGV